MEDFVKSYWKSTLLFIAFGVVAAAAYISHAVPRYEASALIEIAKTWDLRDVDGGEMIPQASYVESAALLSARLSLPSSYTEETKAACLSDYQDAKGESMVRIVSVEVLPNISNTIKISARGESEALAAQCLNAAFQMIKEQQDKLCEPILAEQRLWLKELKRKASENESLIKSLERFRRFDLYYFGKQEQFRRLNFKIEQLARILDRDGGTRLVSPVYPQSRPVEPNRRFVFMFAIISGALFGIGFNLLRCAFKRHGKNAPLTLRGD